MSGISVTDWRLKPGKETEFLMPIFKAGTLTEYEFPADVHDCFMESKA